MKWKEITKENMEEILSSIPEMAWKEWVQDWNTWVFLDKETGEIGVIQDTGNTGYTNSLIDLYLLEGNFLAEWDNIDSELADPSEVPEGMTLSEFLEKMNNDEYYDRVLTALESYWFSCDNCKYNIYKAREILEKYLKGRLI